MRVLTKLWWPVAGFLGLKLGVLAYNTARFPVLETQDVTPGKQHHDDARSISEVRVSVLIPARNEADRLPEMLRKVVNQDVAEIIVLDDESTDETADIAAAVLANHPGGRVVQGLPQPSGWWGKTWACHQLSQHATGDVLIFLDADVLVEPGACELITQRLVGANTNLLSVFPRQDTGSMGEHLVIPLIDDVVLCLLPYWLLSSPVESAATAHGACMAFTRESYNAMGGFAAVRDSIVEDVMLARRVRKTGGRLDLALGGDVVHMRMYTTYGQIVNGLSRGLLPTAGSRTVLVAGWLWHLGVYTVPWLLASRHPRWALLAALGMVERAVVERKTQRRRYVQALLIPLSAPATGPLVWRALTKTVIWRGRSYTR